MNRKNIIVWRSKKIDRLSFTTLLWTIRLEIKSLNSTRWNIILISSKLLFQWSFVSRARDLNGFFECICLVRPQETTLESKYWPTSGLTNWKKKLMRFFFVGSELRHTLWHNPKRKLTPCAESERLFCCWEVVFYICEHKLLVKRACKQGAIQKTRGATFCQQRGRIKLTKCAVLKN